MSQRPDDSGWDAATWEGSRRAQLHRSLGLSVRERLEALETLAESSERLAWLGKVGRGRADSGGSARVGAEVRQASADYGAAQSKATHGVELAGCSPVPLASYLKALGVLRLVAERDSEARAWWENERLYLRSSFTSEQLFDFFLHEYTPTPILSPWSGRAGFLEGEEEEEASTRKGAVVLRDAVGSTADRLRPYRVLITSAQESEQIAELNRLRAEKKRLEKQKKEKGVPKTEKEVIEERLKWIGARWASVKATLLLRLRAELPDETVDWIDACFAVGDEIRAGALLGTGGNEGSMDFSINHLNLLLRLFDPASGEPCAGAGPLLREALLGTPTLEWKDVNPGLLAPASLGGPNMGSSAGGASHENPWDAVLMLEGALLFSATATRRQGASAGGSLSFPFAVEAVNAGHGGVSPQETARPEIWAPLWGEPATLDEVRGLFTEARLTLRRRPARTALDAARAVAKLGADRGVQAFQRFGFYERRGQGYFVTVPLQRRLTGESARSLGSSRTPAAELIDQLDYDFWLGRFRGLGRAKGAPARLTTLVRRLEDCIFRLTEREEPDPRVAQALLATLGEAQAYLATSPKSRESCPPVPRLGTAWARAADDGTAELRICMALAGLHAEGARAQGRTGYRMPMAVHFAPLSEVKQGWDEGAHHGAVWSGGRVEDDLAALLKRRLLDAETTGLDDKPLAAQAFAPLGAIADWLHGDLDNRKIARLLPGLVQVAKQPRLPGKMPLRWPVPAAYALLKPFFCTDAQLRRVALLPSDASLPLPPQLVRHLTANRAGDAVRMAGDRLRAAGLPPIASHIAAPRIAGALLIAALLVPISDRALQRLVRRVVRRTNEQNTDSTTDHQE
jgi:CRISPR-associated protein Csx17